MSLQTGSSSTESDAAGAAPRTAGRHYLWLAALSLFLIVADQATKFWIRATIHETGPVVVIPGLFRLVHVENEGAAWGILSDATYRMPFFIVSTTLAFVVIGLYFSRLTDEQKVLRVALASILGGAIGNFIDRLRFQSVTDFLDFYVAANPVKSWLIQTVGSNRWPSFNIADIAIVVGLGLVIYDSLLLEPRRMKAAELREQAAASGQDGQATRSLDSQASAAQAPNVSGNRSQVVSEGGI